jgi:hypothetical protein
LDEAAVNKEDIDAGFDGSDQGVRVILRIIATRSRLRSAPFRSMQPNGCVLYPITRSLHGSFLFSAVYGQGVPSNISCHWIWL